VVRAPAKLNLHLGVGPLRADGYHELTTVFAAVGLYDELELTRSAEPRLQVSGDDADAVPLDDTNLAVRAVQLLAAHVGADPSLDLLLRKGIPVAGGCAGGSADAAAALVGADALWGCDLPREELAAMAAQLGSDVPFALHGGTALGTGRGEHLTPVLEHGQWSWVLALPEGGLSTPRVYGEFDRLRDTGPVQVVADSGDLLAALRAGDPGLLGAALHNDLQPAALLLRPELQGVLDAGMAAGALGGVVSGSGPTVAFLVRDEAAATGLAGRLTASGTCRAVRCATGPVPGAKVVAQWP
jgi:4-diphosphocytidyl-2-C-methyl-D-erythritol kinase